MATVMKPPIKMNPKIEILCLPDTAEEKPQQGEIISLGPLLLSTAHVN